MNIYNSESHSGTRSNDWRRAVEQLKATKKERQNVGAYSDTPRYLLDQLDREIGDKKAELRPVIVQGIIGEYEASIQNFKASEVTVQKAVSREISHWNSADLLNQMGVYQAQINQIVEAGNDVLAGGPSVADQLNSLYQEARNSADETHMRAAGEVFKGVLSRVGNVDDQTRQAAYHLQNIAKKDLVELRTTEAIQNARMAADQAWVDLCAKRDELAEVGSVLGEDPRNYFANGDIARAWRRVAVVDGQPVIYEPDSVSATGIEFIQSDRGVLSPAGE
jgi:hypothetical protein